MQIRKQQLELDMEQQAGFKSGQEYVKAVCCHPAYLTYMQRISCEMPGWMKHKLELVMDRETWHVAVHGVAESDMAERRN